MAVLLSLLAVVMAGGAAKELQDALVLESTPIDGLPQIEWLGIYPTVETLVAQGIVAAVVVALGLWQRAKAKANTPELSDSHAHS
jgi:high-affinity iron transporter